jgi:hypothetical protein
VRNFLSKCRSDYVRLTETYSEELVSAANWEHVHARSGLNCPLYVGGALYLGRHDSHIADMHVAMLYKSRLKGITSFTSFTCCRVRAFTCLGKKLCLRSFCLTSRTVITRRDSEFYLVMLFSRF